MLIQCCVCHRYREGVRWKTERPPKRRGEFVSHSYCPTCAQQLISEMRRRGLRRGPSRQTVV